MGRYHHVSGVFKYRSSEFRPFPRPRQPYTTEKTFFFECVLLCDVSFAQANARATPVTFHRDELCTAGAHIDWIEQVGTHLVGWQRGRIVLDFHYAPPPAAVVGEDAQ